MGSILKAPMVSQHADLTFVNRSSKVSWAGLLFPTGTHLLAWGIRTRAFAYLSLVKVLLNPQNHYISCCGLSPLLSFTLLVHSYSNHCQPSALPFVVWCSLGINSQFPAITFFCFAWGLSLAIRVYFAPITGRKYQVMNMSSQQPLN